MEKWNENFYYEFGILLLENAFYYYGTGKNEPFLLNWASNWLFSQIFANFPSINFIKMMLNAFLVVVEFVIFTSFQLDLTLGLSALHC